MSVLFDGIPDWFLRPILEWREVQYPSGAIYHWHIIQRTIRAAWPAVAERASVRVKFEGTIGA